MLGINIIGGWPLSHWRPRSIMLLLVASVPLLCAGCGTQKYESRLDETKKYFEYLERIDTSLARSWDDSGFGIIVRVPTQFSALDAPAPKYDEEGNAVPIAPKDDLRQPTFGRQPLPGLLGAWEWVIESEPEEEEEEEESSEATTESGYIYLLGNHQMWIDRETDGEIDPKAFLSIAEQEIAVGFQLPLPTEDAVWEWESESIPKRGGYKLQQDFDIIEFEDHEINGVPWSLSFYKHEIGDIQVMLLVVVPSSFSGTQNLNQRVKYMLEWLTVSDKKPAKHRPTGAEIAL